ncbi:hypothetical protein GPECTOR_132g603 [Gonium pectorale]|uniref:Uncharacterized protein n=1 Tax=Gonium pectorale TaxID=33097 RepID=A0A150FY98_GONPE|nr:hypothetical protein GPECTOR_132g603 [Gonium pectorale]|eukprot:KXZ42591.1 hypothetical protein GPECTOR_132g603 [Gonium pectorale]
MLLQVPALLRHPPAQYGAALAALGFALGVPPPAAVALASANPALLDVPPGALSANGRLLRAKLQLTPAQLAAVMAAAPWLLARSPGSLAAVVRRLLAALVHSKPWSEQLGRLLNGSGRNVAVALSFGSERYERLEYLARSGRDRVMGFKEALSLEEGEFAEVFPEFAAWRRQHGR